MLHRGAIERAEQRPALHPGATALRIHADAAHRGQVDHEPVVRDAQAEHAVPAAAHADLEVALAAVGGSPAATSSALAQRTIARGRRSTMAFHTVRASS